LCVNFLQVEFSYVDKINHTNSDLFIERFAVRMRRSWSQQHRHQTGSAPLADRQQIRERQRAVQERQSAQGHPRIDGVLVLEHRGDLAPGPSSGTELLGSAALRLAVATSPFGHLAASADRERL